MAANFPTENDKYMFWIRLFTSNSGLSKREKLYFPALSLYL